jgi:hypothetical protein
MRTLLKPDQYPQWELDQINAMSDYATDLANRWAIGWPERVKALIETAEYLDVLIRQEYMEREAICWAADNKLRVEDVFRSRGLSLAPPLALPDRGLSDLPGTAGRLTIQLDTMDEHGKPQQMTFFGLAESAYVEMLPHALEPKPDALYRGDYRYDVVAQKWMPIGKPLTDSGDMGR